MVPDAVVTIKIGATKKMAAPPPAIGALSAIPIYTPTYLGSTPRGNTAAVINAGLKGAKYAEEQAKREIAAQRVALGRPPVPITEGVMGGPAPPSYVGGRRAAKKSRARRSRRFRRSKSRR